MTDPLPRTVLLVPPDILCELAHELTVRECVERAIPLDVETEDDVAYTDEAQTVFIAIYDILYAVLSKPCAEVHP